MQKVQRWLEQVYDTKISQQFDRVVLVIGDEGIGKSTLILECIWLWQEIRGREPTPESVLETVVWDDREAFTNRMADADPESAVAVNDAARVLFARDHMIGDQKDAEKSMLDVRIKNHLILLGYQDWRSIPKFLRERRAKNVLYIPTRGSVWGYSRHGIDERVQEDDWPRPQLKDTFPSLEGTDLWEAFKAADREHKLNRMRGDDDEDGDVEEVVDLDELVEEITSNGGLETVTTIHGGWNKPIISKDLLKHEYGLSHSEAKALKSKLDQQVDDLEEAIGA